MPVPDARSHFVKGNRRFIYNFSEREGNLYQVTFYNNILMRIQDDPRPHFCTLCLEPVEYGHRLIFCPDPGRTEARQKILSKLSSLLAEESIEGTKSKSLDSKTINELFSDKKALVQLLMCPFCSSLPNLIASNVVTRKNIDDELDTATPPVFGPANPWALQRWHLPVLTGTIYDHYCYSAG